MNSWTHNHKWENAAHNHITPKSETNSANPKKKYSPWTVDGTPTSTTIAIHKDGHELIPTILHKLTETAKLHQNGILMIESSERPKEIISYHEDVQCKRIIEIRPQTIPWSDQKGPPEEYNQKKSKVPTPTETEHSTQWRTSTTLISSPINDGRWDMDRSTKTSLNQSKIYIFLFHHKNTQSQITAQHARKLSDTLERISAPMSTNGEQEWNTATINIQGHWHSLALRHQPFIHGDPIDPYYNWRTIAFQPTTHLPTNTQTTVEYKPLTQLAKGELVPDGQPPKELRNFLTGECFSQTRTRE